MTKNSLKTCIAALGLMIATPAIGAELCGLEAVKSGNAMSVTAGAFQAACVPQSKCSISLSAKDNTEIALERASVEGTWLTVVKASSSIDAGAGLDLLFNEDDDTRVAPDFLIASEDMKSMRVDDDVSDVVVSTMREAQTLKATVQLVGGKRITHDIKLAGLETATKWVDCAQAK